MKTINAATSLLTKEIHFPDIEPLSAKRTKSNILKRVFKFLTNKRRFKVKEEHFMWCNRLQAYIYTPFFFVYDGASIPKWLNSIYTTIGILFYGACPHDLGYRYEGLILFDPDIGPRLYFQKFSKKELDNIFKELSAEESGMPKMCALAKNVLTVVGIPTWKKWRKLDKKIEVDFPELFVNLELNRTD